MRASRALYARKRRVLADALVASGLPDCRPAATIYHWQRAPEGMNGAEFATRLLEPEIAVVTTPGAGFGACGQGYIRISAFNDYAKVEEALKRIAAVL